MPTDGSPIELITDAELYLMRHGQTEWNASGRLQGIKDSPLTEKGRGQVRAIGSLLEQAVPPGRPVTLYVSPLGRTKDSAEIIKAMGNYSKVIEDERIREVSLGSWDGLSYYEIDREWPGAIEGATAFDWYFRSPDGETFDAALARARAWLQDLSGTVVAVSHGLIGRIIRGAYLGLSRDDMLASGGSPETLWHLSGGQIASVPVRAAMESDADW